MGGVRWGAGRSWGPPGLTAHQPLADELDGLAREVLDLVGPAGQARLQQEFPVGPDQIAVPLPGSGCSPRVMVVRSAPAGGDHSRKNVS